MESTGRRNTSIMEVCSAKQEPTEGHSPISGAYPFTRTTRIAWREDRVKFWAAVARGLKTEEAGVEAGVSSPVAYRWFRHAGGVNPCLPQTVTGRYLSFAEREDIAIWRAQRLGVREIARRLDPHPSTISRELRRNASTRTYPPGYRASTAQWHAERRARRPKVAKLVDNDRLRDYVHERLSAVARTADGRLIGPPGPKWNGKGKPHRADRRWVKAGVPNRSPSASGSISPMMSPCGSATRPSTRLSSSRAVAHSSASWSPACAPGGPYGFHVHEPARRPGPRHPRGDDQRAPAEADDRASRGTGKATSSSGWSVPPSGRWSSALRDSQCSSTFPARRAIATSTLRRTDQRSPVMEQSP